MAVPLEQFVKHLQDSGVLASETLQNFVPPKASPKDAVELARELIRQKKLTAFQAERLWYGKGKSLVLGNYVLQDKIGQGGMGAVYKAEHRRLKRLVAIKMLPPAMLKNAAAAARFQREVEAAAKLRHPNIVATDDADEANGVHFLVMECIEGSDLSALVKKNGPFPVAQAVNCILQAAKGLEFAHKQGVVHRDIKPANLLLNQEGTVKILDMGLARIEGDTAGQAELTGAFAVMGTVDFMAPEQAVSTKHADARADIYSLGCSLYYLLTGRATYDGETLTAKLLAHQNHPIPALRAVRADVPEQVEAAFNKMVAKKLPDRYQSMTEVIAALEGCGGGQMVNPPSFAVPDTELTNFLKEVEASHAAVNSMAVNVTGSRTKPVTAASVGNDRNSKKLLLIGGVLTVAILLAGLVVQLKTKDGAPIVKSGGGKKAVTAKLVPPKNQPVAARAKKRLAFENPGFDQWGQEVVSLPPERQMQAVSKKLFELNPGFDGNLVKDGGAIQNGIVWCMGFDTDNVTDISPVRALIGLTRLSVHGHSGGQGKLRDLSPLKGTKLKELICCFNPLLSDLSPLKGLPLEELNCSYTQVSDLSPLLGMKLRSLSLEGTPTADLSPLRGMPLEAISFQGTVVSDLSPLLGMKLSRLLCMDTQVADLSPLQGMPLTHLNFTNTHVADLSPLKGMPLTYLEFSRTRVSDLSPIEGMPLKNLICEFTPERDTEIVRSIKTLEQINHKPAAEFWKEVEEQQQGKQQ